MFNSFRTLTSLFSLLILLAACSPAASGPTEDQSEGKRLRVAGSISPITNMVYNIGGDRIDLVGILPSGVDPHLYEPRPSDAVRLAKADLIFLNGLGLDDSALKLAEANLKEGAEIVQLAVLAAEPDELIYGRGHHHGLAMDDAGHDDDDGHGHDQDDDDGHDDDDDSHGHDQDDDDGHDDDDDGHGHGQDDGHGHAAADARGVPDPHLLLDPNFVIRYAFVVYVRLAAHDPDNSDFYEANFNAYAARLQALDEAIRAVTATIPESNRRLLTYHDSFSYFARRYGYILVGAVQPSDTSEPSAQEVAAMIEQLRAEKVPAIFGSALSAMDVLERIAHEAGVTMSTLLDEDLPGEPGDPEHTYISMMVENMRTLANSLGGDPSLVDGVEVGNSVDRE